MLGADSRGEAGRMKDSAKAPEIDGEQTRAKVERTEAAEVARRPLSPAVAQRLQGAVGNRALSGVIAQRLARPDAAAAPKFAAVRGDVHRKQKTLSAHPPPAAKANAAQAAAKPPADDKLAQGKAANAEKMNAAQPGTFDKAAFVKAVNEAIAAQAPKNLDEADKFAGSGKADAVKGQVQGQVGKGKESSAKAIETTTKAAPDTSAAKEKPVTPLAAEKAPANPGAPDAANAVPDKAPAAATDFSGGPAQVDQMMAENQVTDRTLASDPDFADAAAAKKEGEQHAATAPAEVRGKEAQTLTAAKAGAAQAGTTALAGMTAGKQQADAGVHTGQEGAQSEDERKRAAVTAKLQAVFDTTKTEVEAILSGLDKKVDDAFTAGEKAARDAFTADHKRRMDAYKDARYSGLLGKGRWIKDKFAGLPDEANQIFVEARKGYVTRMQTVISQVADIIGGELNRAKQRIATGRQQLQAEVAKLPADLQAIGKKAAGDFAGKFDELTESVDAKGKELVQTLASKYNEALQAVDAEIEAEKEKNKGLIAKAVDAVAGVIKTILQLKDLLLGVLAKAASAVMAIIKDPIGFLGHLVSAVGAGLRNFLANIGEHLKKGLIGWLLGAMSGAGLQLPAKFDLRGILSMVASLLGLTWAAIRGRIVQRGVPEQAMGAVEAGVPVVAKLQSGGVAGATEEIQEQVGDLKTNLLGKISEYLIPTVLMAGITWIISLLNPASAFIKACKMIIDIVTFIIERGAQIIEFVNAVLDAVIAIASGAAGGVAKLIENALAKSVPVLIGALAAILGIGGIADKVKKFFQSLSKPVMKAVDFIVGKIVKLGKGIWNKLKAKAKAKGKGKDGAQDRPGEQRKPGDFPSFELGFSMHGAGHRILVKGPGNVAMASREQLLLDKVTNVIVRYRADMDRRPAKANDPNEIARMELLNRIQGQAGAVLDFSRRNVGAQANGSYELERVLRAESAKLSALLADYADRFDARDLEFDPGLPTFPGSEAVKRVLDREIPGSDTLKRDIMWNLAAAGNSDLVRYITGGRFDRGTRNLQAVLRQIGNEGMVPAVRMAFQEAEKLLARGARVIFEPDTPEAPHADIDLATIAGGRLISVYQYKYMSIGNLRGQLAHATDQVREMSHAAHRFVVLRFHDVTRAELTTMPEHKAALDEMNRYRTANPTVTYRFLCADES